LAHLFGGVSWELAGLVPFGLIGRRPAAMATGVLRLTLPSATLT